jgi:hypothetical protein
VDQLNPVDFILTLVILFDPQVAMPLGIISCLLFVVCASIQEYCKDGENQMSSEALV